MWLEKSYSPKQYRRMVRAFGVFALLVVVLLVLVFVDHIVGDGWRVGSRQAMPMVWMAVAIIMSFAHMRSRMVLYGLIWKIQGNSRTEPGKAEP